MKKSFLVLGIICAVIFYVEKDNSDDLLAISNNGEKVIICHIPPGNPDNAHAIKVSINAVDAHLAHGDSIGNCDDNNGVVVGKAPSSPDYETQEPGTID